MPGLVKDDFENILSRPNLGFEASVAALLDHQLPLAGEAGHQDCVGFYYTKLGRNLLIQSDVLYNHEPTDSHKPKGASDAATEAVQAVGHIAGEAWGNVGLYITARDDPTPTRADIEQLAVLHEANPYCVRAFVTRHAVFGNQYFFMRGDRRRGIGPEPLRDWSDELPLSRRLKMLQAADVACHIKGLITINTPYAYHRKETLFDHPGNWRYTSQL